MGVSAFGVWHDGFRVTALLPVRRDERKRPFPTKAGNGRLAFFEQIPQSAFFRASTIMQSNSTQNQIAFVDRSKPP
jgi:hypothetical protein